MITKNSWDWIDRVEVIEINRKYLLIVEKEIMRYNLPKNDEDIMFSDKILA